MLLTHSIHGSLHYCLSSSLDLVDYISAHSLMSPVYVYTYLLTLCSDSQRLCRNGGPCSYCLSAMSWSLAVPVTLALKLFIHIEHQGRACISSTGTDTYGIEIQVPSEREHRSNMESQMILHFT